MSESKDLISFEIAADELVSYYDGPDSVTYSLSFQFLSFQPVVLQDSLLLQPTDSNQNSNRIALDCGLCCYFSINASKLLQKLDSGVVCIFLHTPEQMEDKRAMALIRLNEDLCPQNSKMLSKLGNIQLRCLKSLKVMAELRIGIRLNRVETDCKQQNAEQSPALLQLPAKLSHHIQSQTDNTSVQDTGIQTKIESARVEQLHNTGIQTTDRTKMIDQNIQVDDSDKLGPQNDHEFDPADVLPLFGQFLKLSIGKSLIKYPILHKLTQEIDSATFEQDVRRESPKPVVARHARTRRVPAASSSLQPDKISNYRKPDNWRFVGKSHNSYSRIYLSKPYAYQTNSAFQKRASFITHGKKLLDGSFALADPKRSTFSRRNLYHHRQQSATQPVLKDASTSYSIPQNVAVQTDFSLRQLNTQTQTEPPASGEAMLLHVQPQHNLSVKHGQILDYSKERRKASMIQPVQQIDPSASRRHIRPLSADSLRAHASNRKYSSPFEAEPIYSEEFESDDGEEKDSVAESISTQSQTTEHQSPEAKQISEEHQVSVESLNERRETVVERKTSICQFPPLDARRSSSKQLVISRYGMSSFEETKEEEVEDGALSPVSQYLNKLRFDNEHRPIRRNSSVRTDSVSSYQPSDMPARLPIYD